MGKICEEIQSFQVFYLCIFEVVDDLVVKIFEVNDKVCFEFGKVMSCLKDSGFVVQFEVVCINMVVVVIEEIMVNLVQCMNQLCIDFLMFCVFGSSCFIGLFLFIGFSGKLIEQSSVNGCRW